MLRRAGSAHRAKSIGGSRLSDRDFAMRARNTIRISLPDAITFGRPIGLFPAPVSIMTYQKV